MSTAKLGTFDELMAETGASMRPIARRLREVVRRVDPGAVEVVRLGDRAATYGVGPRKMLEGYCYVLPYTSWVNLGFFHGAVLPDPNGLLEGTGAKMRHFKVRTIEDADAPALERLIREALQERRSALEPEADG